MSAYYSLLLLLFVTVIILFNDTCAEELGAIENGPYFTIFYYKVISFR